MRFRARTLHSSLPADAVVLQATLREGLSQLFRGEVTLATAEAALELRLLLWTDLTLEIYDDEQPDVEPRPFHGLITSAAYTGRRETLHAYRLVFEPSICALRYRVRSRIFQDQSAPDIIKAVLADAGLDAAAFVWDLGETYPARTYCVQYREPELGFVLRLLEEEGLYFRFEHDAAGHTMRFGDAQGSFEPIDGAPDLPFTPWSHETRDSVRSVVMTTRVTHDTQLDRDWDPDHPSNPIETTSTSEQSLFTRYEYPARLHDFSYAQFNSDRRLQEGMGERYRLAAESNCLRLMPGRTVSLLDVKPDALVGEYLLLGLEHRFHEEDRGDQGPRFGYSCAFTAQLSEAAFRPPRVTPRPRVEGIDSAVVTGPAGEEIHTEELGRIKAHFYWDREGAVDDTSSRWIRVQQNNTSGAMMLPRIGWELSVAYQDGDPDRPLALQRLYNRETMPPYGLPDNQTQSAFQSSTSPGGGSVNEVRMQDANGGQQLAVYASRDYNLMAGHDKNERIGVDASETISANSRLTVGADQSIQIGADQTLSVSGTSVHDTAGSVTVAVGANDEWGVTSIYSSNTAASRTHTIGSMHLVVCNHFAETVQGSCDRTIGAAHAVAAAGAFAETVGGSKSETVGGAKMELVAKAKEEQIGAAKSLTSGAVTIKAGQDVAFTAEGAIAVTSAGSIKEKIGEGFAVSGSQIRVTAPGGAKLKGGSGKLKLKGSTLTIDASKFGSGGGPRLQLKGKVNFKP